MPDISPPPVAHKIYGIPQTINTANYVYFLAYQELFKFRQRESSSTEDGSEPPQYVRPANGKGKDVGKGLDEIITGMLKSSWPW